MPTFSDSPWFEITGPPPTVIGGTQVVTMYMDSFAAEELTLPYDAVTDNPGVLDVQGQSGARVTLRAVGSGGARLRILDRGTDYLFDRIMLWTATPVSAELRISRDDLDGAWGSSQVTAIGLGGEYRLVVALYDASEQRVVDTSLSVIGPEGWRQPGGSWDIVEATPTAAGPQAIVVEAGNETFGVAINVVDTLDEILAPAKTEVPVAEEGQTWPFCFRAVTGGDTVLTTWHFGARGDIDIQPTIGRGCIGVRGTQVGFGTLIVGTLDQEIELDLDVVEPSMAAARRPLDNVALPYPGERVVGD